MQRCCWRSHRWWEQVLGSRLVEGLQSLILFFHHKNSVAILKDERSWKNIEPWKWVSESLCMTRFDISNFLLGILFWYFQDVIHQAGLLSMDFELHAGFIFFLGGLLKWSILTTRDHLDQLHTNHPKKIFAGLIGSRPHRKNWIFLHCHRIKTQSSKLITFHPYWYLQTMHPLLQQTPGRQRCLSDGTVAGYHFGAHPILSTLLSMITSIPRWPHREVICIDKVHIEWFFWGIDLCLCVHLHTNSLMIIRCPAP